MNYLGLSLIILLSMLIIRLPRHMVLVPFMIGTCYLTLGQQTEIFGLNFFALRILILVGWVRIIVRREITSVKLNTIDKLILLWITSSVVIYTLLYQTMAALIYRLGLAFTSLGLYFLFRSLVRDLNEFKGLLKMTAVIIIPLAILMFLEHRTGRNVFGFLGGVGEIATSRGGQFRSQGPFRHAILAGTFGATLMPLLVPFWWQERGRLVALLGVTACSIIVFSSKSSGPLMACLFGILGLAAWRFRRRMKIIRWGIVLMLLVLHFIVMRAPVWFLFDRISSLVGGSGWYRAELIEQAITHFGDWWLMGTKKTSSWMPFSLTPENADITNQFIGEGVNGGLLTLILFVLIILYCFKSIGSTLKKSESGPFGLKICVWSMGAALFSHVISFFSVGYFDQIIVIWFLLLATISTVGGNLDTFKANRNMSMKSNYKDMK